jgi:hypothetical protein
MPLPSISNIKDLPRMRLSEHAFMALPEYSATVPTYHENWLRPDRFWRRLDGAHDHAFIRAGGKPYWMIGRYSPIPEDDRHVCIEWFKPVIVVKVKQQ